MCYSHSYIGTLCLRVGYQGNVILLSKFSPELETIFFCHKFLPD